MNPVLSGMLGLLDTIDQYLPSSHYWLSFRFTRTHIRCCLAVPIEALDSGAKTEDDDGLALAYNTIPLRVRYTTPTHAVYNFDVIDDDVETSVSDVLNAYHKFQNSVRTPYDVICSAMDAASHDRDVVSYTTGSSRTGLSIRILRARGEVFPTAKKVIGEFEW